MDPEYREFFYTREPLARLIDHGDISAQLKMKEDMKCKSFDWFMKEIAYDVLEKYPKMPPNKHWGELKNQVSFDFEILGNRNPYAIKLFSRLVENAWTHSAATPRRKQEPLDVTVSGATRFGMMNGPHLTHNSCLGNYLYLKCNLSDN